MFSDFPVEKIGLIFVYFVRWAGHCFTEAGVSCFWRCTVPLNLNLHPHPCEAVMIARRTKTMGSDDTRYGFKDCGLHNV